MELKTRIRELRLASHLTQEQLADRLGITKQAVSQYERGVRQPDYEVLEALADFFNVDLDYLTGRTDKTTMLPQSGYYTNPETARLAQKYFDDPNYRVLFDAAEDSRPEDIQMAAELLRRLKEGSY